MGVEEIETPAFDAATDRRAQADHRVDDRAAAERRAGQQAHLAVL
jgi:hypothetical protein